MSPWKLAGAHLVALICGAIVMLAWLAGKGGHGDSLPAPAGAVEASPLAGTSLTSARRSAAPATPAVPANSELSNDELEQLAIISPRAAIETALATQGHWHRLDALERVAVAWASVAPFDALVFFEREPSLDPEARSRIRLRVLEQWADADAAAVLSYVQSQDGQRLFFFDPDAAEVVARTVAGALPRETLAAAERLPKGLVRSVLAEGVRARGQTPGSDPGL